MKLTFQQFVAQNPGKYPGLLQKLQAEKKAAKAARKERNRHILWQHGMRSLGPPI